MKLVLLLGLILALAVAPVGAGAQLHEEDFGRYVVRANVAHTMWLPQGVLERHGIERASNRVLLDVVVLEAGTPPRETSPATVFAKVEEPSGYQREIDMRAITVGNQVSWVGTVPVDAPRTVLDFTVTVLPETNTALTMHFQERVFRRPEN